MLLAAVSQVKCAAATIILMPACQNASATKCCCQPRGLISLARVPLIITCHYQFWLHLLTRLSGPGQAVYVCIGWWLCRLAGSSLYILATEHRPQQPTCSLDTKGFRRLQLSAAPMYLYTHNYGKKRKRFKHLRNCF